MGSWQDDEYNRQRRERERSRRIKREAKELWDKLLRAIQGDVNDIRAKFGHRIEVDSESENTSTIKKLLFPAVVIELKLDTLKPCIRVQRITKDTEDSRPEDREWVLNFEWDDDSFLRLRHKGDLWDEYEVSRFLLEPIIKNKL